MKWNGKNAKPTRAGWYYTRNHDGSVCGRYYDDSKDAWYNCTAWDGFTPNDSFVEWLWIKEIHAKASRQDRHEVT